MADEDNVDLLALGENVKEKMDCILLCLKSHSVEENPVISLSSRLLHSLSLVCAKCSRVCKVLPDCHNICTQKKITT